MTLADRVVFVVGVGAVIVIIVGAGVLLLRMF